ncbi:hypothetical protein D9757_009701 [Collybiopsis confluens]|uniref:Uncharacterized protein n=1 Tax=Collybiopsis confluens TaxID=2823264 RepID=A0A8H5M138_9AGAR|nr:hypothetical protein D9757_009701 [Collybiopsis confluens]
MENYEGAIGSITVSVLKAGLRPDTVIQLIAVDDIGQVAAGVLKVGSSFILTTNTACRRRAINPRGLIAMNGHIPPLFSLAFEIQEEGAAPDCNARLLAAKTAYSGLRTFEMWATSRGPGKSMSNAMGSDGVSKRDKDWNKVTIGRLVSGKQ